MCKIVHDVQNSQNPSKCPKCTNCTRCTDYYCIYSLNLIEKPQKNKYLFYWRLPLLVDDLKSRDAKASTKVHMASLLKNFNPSQFIFNKKKISFGKIETPECMPFSFLACLLRRLDLLRTHHDSHPCLPYCCRVFSQVWHWHDIAMTMTTRMLIWRKNMD